MATVEGINIDPDQNEVEITNLTIQNDDVVEYLSDFDQAEQEDALVRALKIGTSALELVETSKDVEIVEQRFNEMERDFEDKLGTLKDELDHKFGDDGKLSRILDDHLGEEGKIVSHFEDTFGEDGRFATRLEDELGEGGEKIRQALDPNEPGTPTYQLKQEIKELRDEQAQQEVRENTRLKGFDFEERVEELLGDLVHQTSNRVEDTSEETGEIAGSKKGDFVVTLDETGQKIVVEAKNGNFDGTVESEMEKAIENRDADFGILVASSLDYLPRTKVGWFSEIDNEYVVVALSEDPDDDLEPRFLKFAYHWARTRTLLSAVQVGDETDSEAIKSELDGLKDSIADFSQIRTQCSDLENSVNAIRATLKDIEDDVMARTTRIENELGVGGD